MLSTPASSQRLVLSPPRAGPQAHAGLRLQQRQRRTQLVRRVRDKAAADRDLPFDPGERIVERIDQRTQFTLHGPRRERRQRLGIAFAHMIAERDERRCRRTILHRLQGGLKVAVLNLVRRSLSVGLLPAEPATASAGKQPGAPLCLKRHFCSPPR